MVSKTHAVEPSHIFAEVPSREGNLTQWAKIIICVSFLSVFVLWSLPHRLENGNIVPTIIFNGCPSLFHAFVLSIVFSFTGAFGFLMIGNKPKLAVLRRCYFVVSLVCIASAFLTLACALLLEGCRLVPLGTKLWQNEETEDYFFISSYIFQTFRIDYGEKISPVFEEFSQVA